MMCGVQYKVNRQVCVGGGSSGLVGIQVDLLIDEEDEKRPADTHH